MLHLYPLFPFVSVFFGFYSQQMLVSVSGHWEKHFSLCCSKTRRGFISGSILPHPQLSRVPANQKGAGKKRDLNGIFHLNQGKKNISAISTVFQHLGGSKTFWKRAGERIKVAVLSGKSKTLQSERAEIKNWLFGFMCWKITDQIYLGLSTGAFSSLKLKGMVRKGCPQGEGTSPSPCSG